MAEVVIEFDYRADAGPRLVGPFHDRADAEEWFQRNMLAVDSTWNMTPISDPEEAPFEKQRLAAKETLREMRCINGRCCEVYPMRDQERCEYDAHGSHYFDDPGTIARLEAWAR